MCIRDRPKSEKAEAKSSEQPVSDKPKADDAAPKKARKPRAEKAPADKPKSDAKPAGGNGADAPAERKLLPWEPQQLPVAANPEAKEPKPPAAKEPKPEPNPAESGQD